MPERLSHVLATDQEYPDAAGIDLATLPRGWTHAPRPPRLRWRHIVEVVIGVALLVSLAVLGVMGIVGG
jgi:hypothetical protein